MTVIINASPSNGLTQTADGSGVIKVQSNGVTTNALAWVNFNGTGTVAIRSSYNVSSITDNGTGDYTVNFTNALSDANYTMAGSFEGASSPGSLFPYAVSGTGTAVALVSTTQYRMRTTGPTDATFISATFFGN